MPIICRHLLISGRVQGVCFRHYTRQTAIAHGVNGWVRNLPDGRVEALFEGEESAVEACTAWCHSGPDMARVDQVEIAVQDGEENLSSFSIR